MTSGVTVRLLLAVEPRRWLPGVHTVIASPALPADLPPNVRELIEIALVKNSTLRYRNGGAFADAVTAVRAGRRPPRPHQAPQIGRAAPAAIPSGSSARSPEPRPPATSTRARPVAGSHRQPTVSSTFTSGQRALLWAAGVLGTLAIIIAVLIVINARDNNVKQQQPRPTVTNTVTQPPVTPSAWTTVRPGAGPADSPTPHFTVRLITAPGYDGTAS